MGGQTATLARDSTVRFVVASIKTMVVADDPLAAPFTCLPAHTQHLLVQRTPPTADGTLAILHGIPPDINSQRVNKHHTDSKMENCHVKGMEFLSACSTIFLIFA